MCFVNTHLVSRKLISHAFFSLPPFFVLREYATFQSSLLSVMEHHCLALRRDDLLCAYLIFSVFIHSHLAS